MSTKFSTPELQILTAQQTEFRILSSNAYEYVSQHDVFHGRILLYYGIFFSEIRGMFRKKPGKKYDFCSPTQQITK